MIENEFGRTTRLRELDTLMTDTLTEAEVRMHNNKEGITGIPTGLTDLDRITAGWQKGDLNIPVILLSQLNRESENRPGRRPMLADLRESGTIEQDADVVMLLFRPAMAQLATDKESGYPAEGLGIAIIAKHRNGQTGNVYFGHNQSMTRIGNYVPPMEWLLRNAR